MEKTTTKNYDRLWTMVVGHPPASSFERKLFAEGLLLSGYLPEQTIESWISRKIRDQKSR